MATDFFRKESPTVFANRVSTPSAAADSYGLKSDLIFAAKAYPDGRSMGIKVGGVTKQVQCTVNYSTLTLQEIASSRLTGPKFVVNESDIAGILERKEEDLTFQSIKFLCQNHTKASTHSPFISGCVVNNFQNSKTYKGHKLRLKLVQRIPFRNPYVSGTEAEYFLVGQVKDADCVSVTYLGNQDEDFEKPVQFFVKPEEKKSATV